MGKRVSDEDKQRGQALFALGKSYREIAAELGVSPASVNNWARAEGWLRGVLPDKLVTEDTPQIFESANATPEEREANTDYMRAASNRRWADQKMEMADQFAEGVGRLYDQLFSPVVIKEAKVLSGGKDASATVQIVEIPLNEPSPADKQRLATTMGILIDKASLLVGDATSRVETSSLSGEAVKDRLEHFRDEVAERRRQAAAEAAKRQAAG